MSYVRPTLSEIASQVENDLYKRLDGSVKPVRFSVNKIIARVMAGGLHLVYGFLEYAMRQIIPDMAEGGYLDRHASVWGLKRNSPSKSHGSVVVVGNEDTKIPAFTTLQTADGLEFQTLYDAVVVGGKASLHVEALLKGVQTNFPGQTKLSFISPISGVQSDCAFDSSGAYGGRDLEEDPSLRARLLDRIRNAPCGGNKHDYEVWAQEIAGVTRAWCLPQYPDLGSVGLMFVRDNAQDIFPSPEQVDEVSQHITSLMPCTAKLIVFAPTKKPIDFVIKSSDTTDTAKQMILDQLKNLFFNVSNPSGAIFYTDILESLAGIKSIKRVSLVSPNKDILLSRLELGVVGEITLQEISFL